MPDQFRGARGTLAERSGRAEHHGLTAPASAGQNIHPETAMSSASEHRNQQRKRRDQPGRVSDH